MAKLICETSYDIQPKMEETEKKNGKLYIYGIFSSAETVNENGRVYGKEILSREIEKYKENIKEKTAIGELNHPPQPDINPERAAILVEDLEWKNNDVLGKAKVLESTPQGNIVKSLIEEGVRLGISSRGLGDVNEDGYVTDTYQLLGYDIIGRPSNKGSWVNGIYEGFEFLSSYELKEKDSKIFDCKKVKSQLDKIIRDYKRENQ